MTTISAPTTEILLEMLSREIPSEQLVIDPEVLQSLSHDEAGGPPSVQPPLPCALAMRRTYGPRSALRPNSALR
jgi:hypothetical protein